jgi:hypothetical protein
MRSLRSDLQTSDLIFARRAFWLWLFFAALCLSRPALAPGAAGRGVARLGTGLGGDGSHSQPRD